MGDSRFGKQRLPHPPESFGTRKSRFEADRPSLRLRVARVVYVSQVNFGTWYQIPARETVGWNSNGLEFVEPPLKGGSTKEGITDLEDLGIEVGIPTGGNGVGRKERTTAKAKMPST
jgi:hypothetical protein